jgi:hypothetical protein
MLRPSSAVVLALLRSRRPESRRNANTLAAGSAADRRGLPRGKHERIGRDNRVSDRSAAAVHCRFRFAPPIQFWLPFASSGGASSNLIMAFASL